MQSSIINAKLKYVQPDIHIKTNISGVRVHEFMKAEEIFKNAEPYKDELISKLDILL
jgi:acyl-CoA synthetase (NDP forming)